MSRSGGFCPRCGEVLGPAEGYESPDPGAAREARLCSDCFRDQLELVTAPDELTIRLCTSCGAIVEDGDWVDTDADYTDVAIEAVGDSLGVHREVEDVRWGVEPIQKGPNELDMTVTVEGIIDGEWVAEERSITVRISRETCARCGKIAGDSYAGTVQIRAVDRTPTTDEVDEATAIARDVVNEMSETGDREAFITEITERPEGLDIRVSTTKIGAKIASRVTDELGGTYDTSETLVTEDADGQGVYRVAYPIRLPRVKPDDIVDVDDRPHLVERYASRVELRNLASGETVTLSRDELVDVPHIGSVDDAVETTVVATIDEQTVQILDPRTAETVAISRPSDFADGAETVPVFRYDGTLYALPQEG